MSFNAVDVFYDMREAFYKDRGGLPPAHIKRPGSAQPYFNLGEVVPATSYMDVAIFAEHFLNKTDPPDIHCHKLYLSKGAKAQNECAKAADFEHTDRFQKAKKEWLKWHPVNKFDPFTLLARKDQIYPYNEQFWGAGEQYAYWRNAAGVVPGKWSMAYDSVKESVEELPGRLRKAADAAIPDLPDPTPWVDLLKWGSVAAGLGFLYWFALKPK